MAAKEYRLSIYNNLNGGKTDTGLAHVSPRHISVISSPTPIAPHDTRTSWTKSDIQKTFPSSFTTSFFQSRVWLFQPNFKNPSTIDLRQHLTNSKTMENHSLLSRLKTTVQRKKKKTFTLLETNSSHLEMDGWKTSFLLGWPIARGFCC